MWDDTTNDSIICIHQSLEQDAWWKCSLKLLLYAEVCGENMMIQSVWWRSDYSENTSFCFFLFYFIRGIIKWISKSYGLYCNDCSADKRVCVQLVLNVACLMLHIPIFLSPLVAVLAIFLPVSQAGCQLWTIWAATQTLWRQIGHWSVGLLQDYFFLIMCTGHWHACWHFAKIETKSTKINLRPDFNKTNTLRSHLLIWIRVIVESNPTVICNFREIFIIELLQADVVGWPGNRRDSIFTACHDEAHSALQYACFISDSPEGTSSWTYAQILCSVSVETTWTVKVWVSA